MSTQSQHQSVFRIAKPDATANSSQARTRKRNRQSVSCLACRTRKLKCDRQSPCTSCSKRGDPALCSYDNDVPSKSARRQGPTIAAEAQVRLQRLEQIVTSLMQAPKENSARPTDNTPFQIGTSDQQSAVSTNSSHRLFEVPSGGHLDTQGSETNYVGATHWATVLANIRELQDVLEPSTETVGNGEPSAGLADSPDIVFDTTQVLTLADFCNSLPPRPVVDKLISVYFNTKQLQFLALTHTGKFLREYESFWTDPSSSSFLWVSMLFSVLCLGAQISQTSGQNMVEYSTDSMRALFLKRSAQALVSGQYQKARPYSVEAVLLHAFCKHKQQEEPDSDVWMVMGITARLAMKMGYHRDPRHLKNITPFEGEMRRRVFFFLETFDLLLSFQAGLPTILREEEYDVDLPGNYFDSDLDEDSKVLPPSRPVTDPTPMLYVCSKGRLLRIFRRVFRLIMSFESHSYSDTMTLDHELHEAQSNVPPSLRMKSLGLSITDPAHLIMNRQGLETMYLKVLCVLHRSYLTHDRSNPLYAYSRKTCTNAALKLLEIQAELQLACQQGGQLYQDRWMLSSVTQQDFLLAGMIICLDLYESSKKSASATQEEKLAQVKRYDALKLSRDIWMSRKESSSSSSRDATKAVAIITAMLAKVPRPNVNVSRPLDSLAVTGPSAQPLRGAVPCFPTDSDWEVDVDVDINSQPFSMHTSGTLNTSGTLGSGTASSTASGSLDTPQTQTLDFSAMDPDPLDTFFEASESFDWGLIDQGLLGLDNEQTPFVWPLLNDAEGNAVVPQKRGGLFKDWTTQW